MKKIISIISSAVFITISSYIVVNALSDDNDTNVETKKVVEEKRKEDYEYLTVESDNIESVLKNEVKKEEVKEEIVDPVIEEEPIEEPIIEEPVVEIINGFVEDNGNTYYYENNERVIGQKEIEQDIYYFDSEGIMQKDIVIENCYYSGDGKLYTGFKDIEGNTFYFTIDGFIKGLYEVDNKKYFFDEEGHLIKSSFYDEYYLDENGMVVTGSREIGGRIYIFDEDGKILNGFKTIEDKIYFIDENNERLKGLQLIDNIRYYFDFETGELIKKDVKSIIDISSWQGDIDFEKVKESGLVDGVIVRLGYGTTLGDDPVLDNKFERNISELNRLEIPYGIYFFGYAQNEFASTLEANYTDEIIKKYSVNLSYPIFYDAELEYFDGVKYTKTMYKKVINNYITTLNNLGYSDVGVYGNLYMLTSGGLSSLQKRIPKWVAQYYTRCEYEDSYVGWQYTSDGVIPGIDTKVDMNIFY